MVMNKYTYIGPALMVPKRTGPVTRDVIIDESGRETQNVFNPVTGEKYRVTQTTEVKTQQPDAYIDDEGSGLDEDTLWTPEFCGTEDTAIFLCNNGTFTLDDGDEFLSLADLNIPELLEAFKKKYKHYIDYYEIQYGPIKIDYAAICYWS